MNTLAFYTAGLRHLLEMLKLTAVINTTGGTTAASPVFVDGNSPSSLLAGMAVYSNDFAAGTTVLSVDVANVTMSADATAGIVSPGAVVVGFNAPTTLGPLTAYPLTGAIPTSPDTDYSVFTQPSIPGVLPLELLFNVVSLDGSAGMQITAECVSWTPSGSTVSDTITGVLYTLPGAPDPLPFASVVLDAPKVLATPDNTLTIVPNISTLFIPGTNAGVEI